MLSSSQVGWCKRFVILKPGTIAISPSLLNMATVHRSQTDVYSTYTMVYTHIHYIAWDVRARTCTVKMHGYNVTVQVAKHKNYYSSNII